MSMGGWIVLAAVVATGIIGGWRAFADGRFRGTRRISGTEPRMPESTESRGPTDVPASSSGSSGALAGTLWQEQLGERATLVQFSSAFCAPCRATRQVLSQVAEIVPGVRHLEVDAEHHLDVVRRLGILRTPTTLVLDRTGSEVARASGAPSRDQVLATLAEIV